MDEQQVRDTEGGWVAGSVLEALGVWGGKLRMDEHYDDAQGPQQPPSDHRTYHPFTILLAPAHTHLCR